MPLNLPLEQLERHIGALVLETWAQDAEIQRLRRKVVDLRGAIDADRQGQEVPVHTGGEEGSEASGQPTDQTDG